MKWFEKTCFIESSQKLWVTKRKVRFINLCTSLLKHKLEMTIFRWCQVTLDFFKKIFHRYLSSVCLKHILTSKTAHNFSNYLFITFLLFKKIFISMYPYSYIFTVIAFLYIFVVCWVQYPCKCNSVVSFWPSLFLPPNKRAFSCCFDFFYYL